MAVRWLATVMLREEPGASRGPRFSDRDTSTFTSEVVTVRPSVTEISMLSSQAEDPSCMYCRAFLSTSPYVKVSPSKKKTKPTCKASDFWESHFLFSQPLCSPDFKVHAESYTLGLGSYLVQLLTQHCIPSMSPQREGGLACPSTLLKVRGCLTR